MKQGWENKLVGDVCFITDYVSNGSFASLRENVQYVDTKDYAILVRLADYTNNFDENRFVYINKDSFDFLAKSSLIPGDIIMSNVGSLGKLFLCPDLGQPMSIAPNSILIRTDNNKYYFYYFQSSYFQGEIKKISSTTALPKFNKTQFKKIEIKTPPLPTQQTIVSELDSLSQIIADCKETLKDYDALEQSIFYDMFGDPVKNEKGWEVKPLKDVCREIGDGLHGTPEYSDDSHLYFVNGNNLNDGVIEIKENTKSVTDAAYKQHYIELDDKTLLISINGTLGKVAFYRNEKIILGKSACYLKVGNILDIVYLYRLLSSEFFKNYMESECTGTTIRNVSLKSMRMFNCPIPPLNLQQTFADKIIAIEQMKSDTKAALQEAETLFNARMDYWFN